MKQEKTLIILTTNDLHGALVSGAGVVGADYTAALKRDYKGALLLDAGDAIQGSALAALSKGRDVIALMNAAGYDAMAAGNHEFDYGLDTLLTDARRADFPILSANGFRDGKPVLAGEAYRGGHKINNGAYILLKRQGVSVGIFGITTPEIANGTGEAEPKEVRGIHFKSPLTTSRETIKKLKELGAEIIICLAHLGIDPGSAPENQSVGLAEALGENSGLDIIIDGHSHSVFAEKRINGILLQQSGSGAQRIGKNMIDPVTHSARGSFLEEETIKKSCKPDKKVTELADLLVKSHSAKLAPVVARVQTALWGGTVNGINEARVAETNLGDAIADAMADAAKERFKSQMTDACIFEDMPVIALHNGGGIRASLHRGQITAGDCLDVLPFGNRLYFREATPRILYQALENGVSRVRGQDPETGRIIGAGGCFPQISGMTMVYSPDRPVGERVMSVTLDSGQLLDPEDDKTPVILVIDEAKLDGGDGYTMLMHLPELGDAGILETVFRDWLTKITEEKGAVERPPSISRIQTAGVYQPKRYDACVHITQGNRPAPGKHIAGCIDGETHFQAILEKDSILHLRGLADGPHTISIDGGDEVLVNNYSGAGLAKDGIAVSVTLKKKSGCQEKNCRTRRRTARKKEGTLTQR